MGEEGKREEERRLQLLCCPLSLGRPGNGGSPIKWGTFRVTAAFATALVPVIAHCCPREPSKREGEKGSGEGRME